MDSIRNAPSLNEIFPSDNYLLGNGLGARNNFAVGYYTDGAELLEEILNKIRLETEKCESFQGFQCFHSLGGGTGSGLTSLLLKSLRDEYSSEKAVIATFTVLPSKKTEVCVVEPYHVVLAMNHLIEYANETFIFDNEALFDICQRKFSIEKPNYNDFNEMIVSTMKGLTSAFRFPPSRDSNKQFLDYRRIAENLLPNPRLHFFHIRTFTFEVLY